MASEGNNTNIKNSELRDVFLGTGVGKYIKRAIKKTDNKPIAGISELHVVQKVKLKDKIRGKLASIENESLRESVIELLEVTTLEGKYIKEDLEVLGRINPTVKRVYVEMLMACVDEGLFDENEMQLVENEIAFMLSSIVDLNNVNVMVK